MKTLRRMVSATWAVQEFLLRGLAPTTRRRLSVAHGLRTGPALPFIFRASLAAAMAAEMPHERGEEALRVVLKHLGVLTANAIAGYFDGQLLTEENAPLSEELQVALRNVAAREAHAATVARLACASSEARKLAAAALPVPERYVCWAKRDALVSMVATARDARLLDKPGVEATLVALCADDAVPPGAAGDEAAAWLACEGAAIKSLDAMPDAQIASFTHFLGAAAAVEPGQAFDALEDPAEIGKNCREARAERFVAVLNGTGLSRLRRYSSDEDSDEDSE